MEGCGLDAGDGVAKREKDAGDEEGQNKRRNEKKKQKKGKERS